MFHLVCKVLQENKHELYHLQHDDQVTFTKHVPYYFGCRTRRYTHMFPLLLLLLHSPACIGHCVDAAQVREGYEPQARWVLLVGNALRYFSACAEEAMVPWLLVLYRWAAAPNTLVTGFHKMLLAPAALLLQWRPPHMDVGVPMLTLRDLADVLHVTTELEAKFIADARNALTNVRQPSMTCLPNDDARLISSLYAKLLQHGDVRDGGMLPDVVAAVRRSGEGALMEVAAANIRMRRLAVAHLFADDQRELCSTGLAQLARQQAGAATLCLKNT